MLIISTHLSISYQTLVGTQQLRVQIPAQPEFLSLYCLVGEQYWDWTPSSAMQWISQMQLVVTSRAKYYKKVCLQVPAAVGKWLYADVSVCGPCSILIPLAVVPGFARYISKPVANFKPLLSPSPLNGPQNQFWGALTKGMGIPSLNNCIHHTSQVSA